MPHFLLLSEDPDGPGNLVPTLTAGDNPDDALRRVPHGNDPVAVVDLSASRVPLDQLRAQIAREESTLVGKIVAWPRCPFCGGKGRVKTPQVYNEDERRYEVEWGPVHVVCWNCDAAGPGGFGATDAIRGWASRMQSAV